MVSLEVHVPGEIRWRFNLEDKPTAGLCGCLEFREPRTATGGTMHTQMPGRSQPRLGELRIGTRPVLQIDAKMGEV